MKIIISTHNKDKLEELLVASKGLNNEIDFSTLEDFPNIGDIEETGKTLEENALIKARTVHSITGLPALSDDTGLEVDALHGAPGVYTARYAGENCSYMDNVNKLLESMLKVPIPNRTAQFKTVVAYVDSNVELIAEGCAKGFISRAAIGDNGFGYDPIFFIPEVEKTFAEMKIEEKEIYSHRGKAIRQMFNLLKEHFNNLNKQNTKEMA